MAIKAYLLNSGDRKRLCPVRASELPAETNPAWPWASGGHSLAPRPRPQLLVFT